MAKHNLGNVQRLGTEIRVDPRLVVAGRLLRLAQSDLDSAIENELAENPALERLEPVEPVAPIADPPSWDRPMADDDESPDLADFTADHEATREHIRAELRQRVPTPLGHIADYFIDSLTDTGYLEEPIEEIALACRCSMEQAEEVLAALHQCEPAGVGARNVVECLLIQLRDEDSLEGQIARDLVANHLDLLQGRDAMGVARRYRVMPEVAEAAFALILGLRPYPLDPPAEPRSRRVAARIRPDLILRREESGWQIEVPGPGRDGLRISSSFEEAKGRTAAEKRHLGHYVQRARGFLDGLEQRRRTLRLLGEALLRHQSGFILTGEYMHLAPLTRARLADEMGLHESTVSRATSDKFVQIANGEIVSFDVFFKAALRVQRMIEEILTTEDPSHPMSDERIAQILAERGVVVARRTVSKYRDRHKLPSSRRRRSA
ncbi:MAG: RNA polymerase factor sigma-54 [Fimbriimonas sp.]